jgi:predicted SPOUT superfamily RNA methylase MTH1
VLNNAQTAELRTYLAGQIARAAAIFSVDEIVVFDDVSGQQDSEDSEQLARILQYLECPQYLRKHFFPLHKDLQYAGVLNPTDMPHHLRQASPYEERLLKIETEAYYCVLFAELPSPVCTGREW